MSTKAQRQISITYSGDKTETKVASAGDADPSLAVETIQDLAIGNNTVTIPASSGVTLTGVTLIPPSGNTQALTLKGVNGDTGIPIHKTDPTSLGLGASPAIVLNAGGTVNGFRFFWT